MAGNSIWVVISATESYEKLLDLIDRGHLAEAVGRNQALASMTEKTVSIVQQYGGYLPISIMGRIVMQVPFGLAEQLPNIIQGFNESLGEKVAAGIGMTFEEASHAAQDSVVSGEIEMFDPEDQMAKALHVPTRRAEPGIQLPVNLFNPETPDDEVYKETRHTKDAEIQAPTMEESMQIDGAYIQMMLQQMGGGQPQQPQQGMEGGEEGGAPPTRDLLETLHGEQVQGYNPKEHLEGGLGDGVDPNSVNPQQLALGVKVEMEHTNNEAEAKEIALDHLTEDPNYYSELSQIEGDDAQEVSQKVTQAEQEAEGFDQKLAGMLHNVKEQLPQIMQLADKNPEAFKQTMNLINKLSAAAKQGRVKKAESAVDLEELNKNLQRRINYFRGFNKPLNLPEGSIKGKAKKVMVNGKEVWREMSSGQVQDEKGQPISVKSSNLQAQK